jgi:hypothetical protein
MQFRLVYQGPLPSGGNKSNKPEVKQAIREQFHPQLKELWRTHPFLKNYFEMQLEGGSFPEHVGSRFAFCGYRFVPLIGSTFRGGGDVDGPPDVACSLDILILRRDHPAQSIVQNGGDVDNRIKILFDALHIPQSCSGIKEPEDSDNVRFCLLEDDKLITEVKISTGQLLVAPPPGGHPDQYAHVIIHVKTLVIGASGFIAFMA